MFRRGVSRASIAILLLSSVASADPRDTAAARELAKQGYELKLQKQWEAARERFAESTRIDPVPKNLVNLAECEAEMGNLVDAQRHLVEARDLATNDAEIRAIAVARLEAVEKRMPRITVRVAQDAPAGTRVSRDGVTLRGPSLDTPLPTNPGEHVIVAHAEGRADKVYRVSVAEAETLVLVVAPGEPSARSPTKPESMRAGTSAPSEASGTWSTLRIAGAVTAGGGLIGLGGATFLALSAKGQRDEAGCRDNVCPTEEDAKQLRAAKQTADLATFAFAAGGALALAGVTLWLLAPSPGKAQGQGGVQMAISPNQVVVRTTF